MTRRAWWLAPPLLLVAGFFLYPLYFVVRESLTGDAWSRVASSGRFLDALGTTVMVSLAATAGCVVLGTFLALVLAFTPFPGAGLVTRLVDTLLAFPSFLIALAFTFLYGSAGIVNAAAGREVMGGFLYSPWCVIAAEITFYTPFVMRPLLASFKHFPREQLDVAASLGARPWRVFRRVVLPEAWPALGAGASLTLLLTLNEFGIVLFIGAKDVETLPMLVHSFGVVTFDLPAACVVAVIEVALSLSLYAVYRRAFGGGR
ncbi:2-aminoethylphosphonate ABC transporter permease [Actinorhabdospora filicis]|uniref:2-aminoethylphosphonate ABC transporter permease n=1 Tax=Actinorhabdospora filicis TaxID=1785913 RepID=A0A9W6SS63_9ACTN|nr:2-aminoethylphosphonate ABC transporter permease subunit [Actinorhabdospora filicis]GLZ81103.1 2-aminoethylphosphonate ABC transporter permease [Actinorhabdospora filicis]